MKNRRTNKEKACTCIQTSVGRNGVSSLSKRAESASFQNAPLIERLTTRKNGKTPSIPKVSRHLIGRSMRPQRVLVQLQNQNINARYMVWYCPASGRDHRPDSSSAFRSLTFLGAAVVRCIGCFNFSLCFFDFGKKSGDFAQDHGDRFRLFEETGALLEGLVHVAKLQGRRASLEKPG
jgi:hypothetical protein